MRHLRAVRADDPVFEALHPRGFGGQFIRKQLLDSDISLGFLNAVDIQSIDLADFAEGAPIVAVTPRSQSESASMLDAGNAINDNAIRWVKINDPMALLDQTTVTGPSDGRPLLIDVKTGYGHLNIESGYVIIRTTSDAPTTVTVGDACDATVIIGRGRTAEIVVKGISDVTVFAEENARGIVRVENELANVEVLGDAARVPVANVHAWNL